MNTGLTNWESWFEELVKNSTMSVEDSSLEGMDPWELITLEDGRVVFGRKDRGFFQLEGVKVTTRSREVREWKQPLLRELPGGGIVVVGTDQAQENFLFAAREEPGNSPDRGYMLLGPTLQTSESNLRKAHGGEMPPRTEFYDAATTFDQPQDGGRYRNKVNRTGYVVLDPVSYELKANERWFTREEAREARRKGLFNQHLSEAMSLFF